MRNFNLQNSIRLVLTFLFFVSSWSQAEQNLSIQNKNDTSAQISESYAFKMGSGVSDFEKSQNQTDGDEIRTLNEDAGVSVLPEASPWGYMAKGMSDFLPLSIVAEENVNNLFQKFAHLRDDTNVVLPSEFDQVIEYLAGYIKSNAAAGAEASNGLTSQQLAAMIVEASFCFGTDPFMVAAKIRRETSFKRTDVSSGGAVGFSQMTGAGIKEVQHQMSGNPAISPHNAQAVFQKAINCFIGPSQFNYAAGDRVTVQNKISTHPYVDLIFGQILTKTYISYVKTLSSGLNKDSYRTTFALYNGDSRMVRGQCMKKRVQLKFEYACDIMTYYNNLNTVWNQFLSQ